VLPFLLTDEGIPLLFCCLETAIVLVW
jgi:hypothetical protein